MGLPAPTPQPKARQHLHAPVLPPQHGLWLEAWHSATPPTQGCRHGVHWRRCGDVLYGVLELDEADFVNQPQGKPPLQAASETAYHRLFALLDEHQLPHLWRVWNYVTDINGESHGLERYRQFNVGRHDAFVACDQAASGNLPTACALGVHAGPALSIAFMAGAHPALPIENPRQISAYDYPAQYGPRAPMFSRAALVQLPGQEALMVSGTASIVGHRTLHVGQVDLQCQEALRNIEAVVQAANQRVLSAPFALHELVYRVYLRHPADLPAAQATLTPLLAPAEVLYVQADICRSDLLVEIEATALHALPQGAGG